MLTWTRTVGIAAGVAVAAHPAQADPPCVDRVTARDGINLDYFGSAVALAGHELFVGMPGDDELGESSGSVRVYAHGRDGWVLRQTLTSSAGGAHAQFGAHVAIADGLLAVGEPYAADAGAVALYARDGDHWRELQRVTASDAAPNDQFGAAIAIDGNTMVVGAPGDEPFGSASGSAYVFKRAGLRWVQQQRLEAWDESSGAQFGGSVAVAGDSILVGARHDAGPGDAVGAVYGFRWTVAWWSEDQKLTPTGGTTGGQFGMTVAASRGMLLVGAPQVDGATGAAWLFRRGDRGWIEDTRLVAPDVGPGDAFGYRVALAGDRAVVGAPNQGTMGLRAGAAYVFERGGTDWRATSIVRPFFESPDAQLGSSVATDGETVAVGARGDRWDGAAGEAIGSVFVRMPCDSGAGRADINRDGRVDRGDLDAVLSAWGPCEDCRADLDADGAVGGSDLQRVMGSWTGS